MAVDKQELLSTAVGFEKEGRAFYLETAAKAANELARKTFESFADDELRHIEWLEEISKTEEVAVAEPRLIVAKLKQIFAEAPEEVRATAASTDDDIKAIDIAVENEVKSKRAYVEWADALEDGGLKNLCLALADMEENHRVLLENAKEYLTNTGNWFMGEEQWLFDGG